MVQRQKLELAVNHPVEVELLYDEPIAGESQYGSYNLYAVRVGEVEYAFFPPKEVHDVLKDLKQGDKAIVTKLAALRGKKVVATYDVAVNGKTKSKSQAVTSDTEAAIIEEPKADRYYEIMHQSFQDAIRISNDLNGMAEPTRIAITLFIQRTKNGNGSNGFNH